MSQWLKTLAAFPENPGSISSTHMTAVYNSSFRASDTLFWPPWTPVMQVVNRHTCSKTSIQIIIVIIIVKSYKQFQYTSSIMEELSGTLSTKTLESVVV